jgi:hypothetical protein
MRVKFGARCSCFAAATLASAVGAASAAQGADVNGGVFQDGKAGFIITHFAYALSKDASETGACPSGMTQGAVAIFSSTPEGARHEAESDQDYSRRQIQGANKIGTAPNGENLCLHPEAGGPDPHFVTVTGKDVPAEGIDLDGQDSHVKGKAAPGTCPHEDFRGFNGERGIDNQFFRAVGCSQSFQSTGQSNTFEIAMYAGEWSIVLTLAGVTDPRNAKDVQVGIYASPDPMQLSPARVALENATYAIDQDPRFRATTHGRIVNGVLTTEPVDVRFHWVVNGIHLERPLRQARLRVTFNANGEMDGILAGYTPIDDMYDLQFAYRNGKDAAGKPASNRLIAQSANGGAHVLGYTCNGAYYALKQYADGDRDPKSGDCSSISTQYRIQAVPAFIVDTATQSVNTELDKGK